MYAVNVRGFTVLPLFQKNGIHSVLQSYSSNALGVWGWPKSLVTNVLYLVSICSPLKILPSGFCSNIFLGPYQRLNQK